jgi:hypothetical protein
MNLIVIRQFSPDKQHWLKPPLPSVALAKEGHPSLQYKLHSRFQQLNPEERDKSRKTWIKCKIN